MEAFHSIHCQHDNIDSLLEDIRQQLAASEGNYNFGFIYATDAVSDSFDHLLALCREKTGISSWVGTLGVGIIADHNEYYEKPAVSIMLANFDSDDYLLLPKLSKPEQLDAITSRFATHFGIIHGDPYNEHTHELIAGLAERLDNGFLTGGLTSSHNDQWQVCGDVLSGGISGVVFSEQVVVATNLSQGCRPVGEKHHITKARDNILFSLDREPSLDVMMSDLGVKNLHQLNEQANDVFVGLCVPGSDISDYTVRNIIGLDVEQRVFAINDYLTEGNELLLCRRDLESAEADMHAMLERLASRITTTPRGGVYFSCLGRGRQQFGDNAEEIKMIHQHLGDFPLTGFFANGEIHHNRLYGYTGVLTLFV